MTAWKIKDWGARPGLFEVSQSKRYSTVSWLPIPINLNGAHYEALMASREGQSAYAIFLASACYAATLRRRGMFIDEKGPIPIVKVAQKLHAPPADVQAAWDILSGPEIEWYQEVAPSTASRIAREIKKELRSEQTRSRPGAGSVPEQEQEQAAEQERDRDISASKARELAAPGVRLAAGSLAVDEAVLRILDRFWKRSPGKARALAENPNATYERVCWLADRVIREKPKAPPGFIRKGIEEGWEVPADWLDRFQRATA